ncbi:MAG: hypothetical protein LBE13_02580 [Bacteroidales bacterium]|jgi:tetratricopeptide (TPR) repeat protein|nr:hypothetical protein [Bacteroidales bacterium]
MAKTNKDSAVNRFFDSLVEKYGKAGPLIWSAQTKLKHQKYQEAIELFSRALEIDKNSVVTHVGRASAKVCTEDYRGAIDDFNNALAIDKNNTVAYADRGLAKKKLNDFHGAIEDYTKALELNSSDVLTYTNRASARICIEDYKGAMDDCASALKLEPGNINAVFYRGMARRGLKDYHNAITDFSLAIQANNKDYSAYSERAEANLEIKDYKGAIIDFTKVLDINNPNNYYYFRRAVAEYYIEDYQAALVDLNKILETGAHYQRAEPSFLSSYENLAISEYAVNAEVYNLRGLVQIKLGNLQDAQRDLGISRRFGFDGEKYRSKVVVDEIDKETSIVLKDLVCLAVLRQIVGIITGMAHISPVVMSRGYKLFRETLLSEATIGMSDYKTLEQLLENKDKSKQTLLNKSKLLHSLRIPELDDFVFKFAIIGKFSVNLWDTTFGKIFEELNGMYLQVACSIWLGVFDQQTFEGNSIENSIQIADEAICLTQFMSGDIYRPANPSPMVYETGLSQTFGLLATTSAKNDIKTLTDTQIILHLIHVIMCRYYAMNKYSQNSYIDEKDVINFFNFFCLPKVSEMNEKIQSAIYKAAEKGQILSLYNESTKLIANALTHAYKENYENCIGNLLLGVDSMLTYCGIEITPSIMMSIRNTVLRTKSDLLVDVVGLSYKGFKHLSKGLGKAFSKLSEKFKEIDKEMGN